MKIKVHKFTRNLKDNINLLMEDQKKANKLHYENPTMYKPVHTLLILDDCIDSRIAQFRSSENIADEIAERGRHYNVSMIVSSQYLSSISPSLRRNAEFLFLFSPTNYADTERVLGEFVPSEVRKEFRELVMRVYLQPYSFMIVDNSPLRRRFYKLRFRKGFSELVFPFDKSETERPTLKDKKRKNTEIEESESGSESGSE